MPSPLLRLHQVSLNSPRGVEPLLQDISFEVMPGERVAIVGPSGAGKTTLLRTLNRLSEISGGTIYFGDRNIQQIPVIELRQEMTLVPQESKLLGMTVRQALAYPLQLRKLSQKTIQQRLMTWTEQLHLPEDWLERNELQLSVGCRTWGAFAHRFKQCGSKSGNDDPDGESPVRDGKTVCQPSVVFTTGATGERSPDSSSQLGRFEANSGGCGNDRRGGVGIVYKERK
jgi:predicted ABC-type transport system involved in lysophospholipase L1 biosynthesis ATPase subunit